MKRFLSILLAVLMLAVMLPVTAMADEVNYVTLELTYGSNVSDEDIAAAKVMYENVQYPTCKAANEAYMALFGVTWKDREGGTPYLDVTDNTAPLNSYKDISGSVTEVKYYIHGTLEGFTSLYSDGNQIDCTIGGNHQIFRTSYSIIGVNNTDGSKAKLTDGNVQAYVAGGYDGMYTSYGKLTIDNIEFATTTSTTVGASAANGAVGSTNTATGEMEIKNCKFNGRLYVYDDFVNTGMTYNIHDNVFDGTNYSGDNNAYPIFAQCKGGNTLNIKNNNISGYARGINIDHANVKAVIEGNTISVTDRGRSCIQLSSLTTATIKNNTMNLTGGNAITLHEKLLGDKSPAIEEITISGNTINGTGYLIYDDATANNKSFTNDNLTLTITKDNTVAETVDITQGVKGSTKYGMSEIVKTTVENNVVPGGSTGGTIVIVPDRTEDTPKTEDQKNPSTGANDVVAAAVALMAVSALGMAVLTRKK